MLKFRGFSEPQNFLPMKISDKVLELNLELIARLKEKH